MAAKGVDRFPYRLPMKNLSFLAAIREVLAIGSILVKSDCDERP